MKEAFNSGQTVYDRDGRVYEFAGMMGGQAIVRPLSQGDGWDGEGAFYVSDVAEIRSVTSLSKTPPTPFINADVALATAKLADLDAAIRARKNELVALEKDFSSRIEKLKRYAALSRVEDFLEGRMTHFAIRSKYGRGVEIKTFDELMKCKNDYGRFDGDIKLLSLFGTHQSCPENGNKNGDLLWRVNQYYDGSGSGGYIVQPCLSEDEARGVAMLWLQGLWEEHRGLTDRATRAHWLKDTIESANALGVEVPDDIQADFDGHLERAAKARLEKAEAELAVARKAIAGGIA